MHLAQYLKIERNYNSTSTKKWLVIIAGQIFVVPAAVTQRIYLIKAFFFVIIILKIDITI